jgi:hypothetical protein
LTLLRASAWNTWASVTAWAARRAGSMTTWYCRFTPPKAFTSTTPGTLRSRGEISQSRSVRSSIGVRPSPFTTNW